MDKGMDKGTTTRTWSPWLTVPEGAAYVRKRLSEFRKLVNSGEIRSYKRSARSVYVDARELDAWMRSFPSGASTPSALVSKS